MTVWIKQSSTQHPLRFFLVQSSDHITGLTGASPTVTISKAGAAFAAPSGAVTEIANGWYKVAANATDTNTLGSIDIHATATSGDPCDVMDAAFVVPLDPTSTAFGLSLAKTTNLTGFNDIAATAIVSAGAITTASGAVSAVTTVTNLTNAPTAGDFTATMKTSLNAATPASVTGAVGSVTGAVGSVTGAVGSVTAPVTLAGTAGIKKNTALNAFPFPMTDSTNHNPLTGATVTALRSLDGAAFAVCANAVTETGSGWYQINLAAADLNGNTVALKFTATGADQTNIAIVTQT